jgi:hypothetical protein
LQHIGIINMLFYPTTIFRFRHGDVFARIDGSLN